MANNSRVRHIHVTKSAVKGKIYLENGIRYIGNADGTLSKEEYLDGDISGTTLNSKIEVIGEYKVEELINIINSLVANNAEDININSVTIIDDENAENSNYILTKILEQLLRLNNKKDNKMDYIIDGLDSTNKAKVRGHKLFVRNSDLKDVKLVEGRIWRLPFVVTPAGANDKFVYLKNTGNIPLLVKRIVMTSSAATRIDVKKVSGSPVYAGKVDIEPVSINSVKSIIPSVEAAYDTDITTLTDQGDLDFIDLITPNTTYEIKDVFLMASNSVIALERIAATGEVKGYIELLELNNDDE